jgi:hypothetical protein
LPPTDLPVRALSSRFIWLSTRISFSVICGKLTANEMMVGPAPEWPMTMALSHFITRITASMSSISASSELSLLGLQVESPQPRRSGTTTSRSVASALATSIQSTES